MSEKKIVIVAVLLSIISGLGNIYNGLFKRGLFELFIGILFFVLTIYASKFFCLECVIWIIFCMLDTYFCTKAINNNEEIPKLLGKLKIE